MGAVISKKLALASVLIAIGATNHAASATPSTAKGRAWSSRWDLPILTRSA
jgi:hypothetical protein